MLLGLRRDRSGPRLEAPDLGVRQIVLAGASGRTLAFGPGHMDGTAAPGASGHAVISGHRDTHFRFLQDLATGDALRVKLGSGALATTVTGHPED